MLTGMNDFAIRAASLEKRIEPASCPDDSVH
jgi:hypothetical protein